jgi:DNA-binding HxlR family transcriptional regulator
VIRTLLADHGGVAVLEPQEPQSAIDLVRHKWLLEILHAVAAGPQRRRDLLGALGGVGDPVYPKTLGATLSHLCSHGLVAWRIVKHRPRIVIYEATPLGLELMGILETLERFVDQHQVELDPRSRGHPAED